MSFREDILIRVRDQLRQLVVEEGQVTPQPNGELHITPNPGFTGVLRNLDIGPLETKPVENLPTNLSPAAFVSFDGGRNDLGLDTFLSHIVETLGIRIEVLLNRKIGVAIADEREPDGVRPRRLSLQASDFLTDLNRLITLNNLRSAVNPDNVTVQEVIIEEWEFDERFRGSEQELLNIVIQAQVANERVQTPLTPASGNGQQP